MGKCLLIVCGGLVLSHAPITRQTVPLSLCLVHSGGELYDALLYETEWNSNQNCASQSEGLVQHRVQRTNKSQ